MISKRIKEAIENTSSLTTTVDISKHGQNWTNYTRTIFMNIARCINKDITSKVIENPSLIVDCLLIGENEIDKILFKEQHSTIEGFIHSLKNIPPHRTHNWISGKTLQSYWHGANAKDKKLNVLLTFLNINQREWDDWKTSSINSPASTRSSSISKANSKDSNYLLKKYYLGSYYRYYQKADSSPVVIKTPFVIKEDENGNVVAQSKTIGHRYQSFSIEVSDGALYINFKNLDWDEREHHIFNIGIATSPKVLIGVSNSLNNRKQAIAKRNVIIKQDESFDYENIEGVELPYDMEFDTTTDDSIVVEFFKRRKNNLIITSLYYNLNELESLNHHPI